MSGDEFCTKKIQGFLQSVLTARNLVIVAQFSKACALVNNCLRVSSESGSLLGLEMFDNANTVVAMYLQQVGLTQPFYT